MKLRTWQIPTLTVLARSNPEEAVLEKCKTSSLQGPFEKDKACIIFNGLKTVACSGDLTS